MQTLTLHDGTPIPAVGLGTWKPQGEDVYRAVRCAIAAGYRHVDCAAAYANEDVIGRALADAFAAGDVRREEMWVTSKLWNDRHAPQHVQPALEQTLEALGLDHLDLYLMHWPVALRPGVMFPRTGSDFVHPEEIPIETTWAAMAELVGAGLTRYVGVSNFTASKIRRVHEATGVLPAVDQVELHPYLQQSELLEATRAMGVVLTAYSPLGTPDSEAMFRRNDAFRLLDDPVIGRIAAAHGVTPGQVLVGWAVRRGTIVVPKSTNEGRIRENLAAADLALDPDDMTAIAGLDRGHRYIDGSFWCSEGSPWTTASLWDD